ncbi:hypothetical protein [Enterococcus termitis]|uniref:Uncharacterized protein n=1 Tax=Enterococcus termitis TaxID=332950 RepID=A0A1E5GU36_9ENTE|nr:hypothetical protein [Enterococcus termitis]OEG16172.1 hypothetical protein BCR25_18425 [Enterococcus termitis]OJG96808.1 hypothetical protein RV18_GL001854 [Enterococcus termitis]
MYTVIEKFRDLQDNNKIYEIGDEYIGKKSKKRLAELTTDKNKIGKPLIILEEDDDQEEKETEELEAEESEE